MSVQFTEPEIQKFQELARNARSQYLLKLESPDIPWSIEYTRPEIKLSVYSVTLPGSSWKCFKGVCELPFDSIDVLKFACDATTRHLWDTSMESMVEYPLGSRDADNNDYFVSRVRFNSIGPISPRELFDVGLRNTSDPSGTVFHVFTGIDDTKRFPETSGYVRALNLSGNSI